MRTPRPPKSDKPARILTAALLLASIVFAVWTWWPRSVAPRLVYVPADSAPDLHGEAATGRREVSPTGERIEAPGARTAPVADGQQSARHRVQLVARDARGGAVPDAAVVWADEAAVRRAMAEPPEGPEPMHLAGRIARVGHSGKTDAQGRLEIEVDEGQLHAHASAAGLAGSSLFSVGKPPHEPFVIVLQEGDVLSVRLVDPQGVPIVDAPVAIHWPVEVAAAAGDPLARSPLGRTDETGAVAFPDWRKITADLERMLPAASGRFLVGPAYPGAVEQGFVPAPLPVARDLLLTCPRPREVAVEIRAATGVPIGWGGVQLEIAAEDDRWYGFAVRGGRANPVLVADRRYRWRVAGIGVIYGSGEALFAADAVTGLACGDIVQATGRLGVGEVAQGIVYRHRSMLRRAVQQPLVVAADRTFAVFLPREDSAVPIEFVRGPDQAVLVPKAIDQGRADLGTLTFAGGEQAVPVPFATLKVVDEKGQPLRDCIVAPTGNEAERAKVPVKQAAPGEYAIAAPADMQQLTMYCNRGRSVQEFVVMTRGRDEQIVLERPGICVVTASLPNGIDPEHVWVSLSSRLNQRTGHKDPMRAWARLQQRRGEFTATFPDLRPGQYAAVIQSIQPVSVLARADLDLRIGAPAFVAIPDVQQTVLRLQAPADGPTSCWIAVGSCAQASSVREPLRLREVPIGDLQITLSSAEREVLVGGPGLVPVLVDVHGASRTVLAARRDPTKLPGIDVTHEILQPVGATFAAKRLVQMFRPREGEVDSSQGHLEKLAGAAACLWPCAYEVRVPDRTEVARWERGGWTLSR